MYQQHLVSHAVAFIILLVDPFSSLVNATSLRGGRVLDTVLPTKDPDRDRIQKHSLEYPFQSLPADLSLPPGLGGDLVEKTGAKPYLEGKTIPMCPDCSQRLGAGDDPFIVSFRIRIQDGDDNAFQAQKIATLINTIGSEAARQFPMSVARVQHSTFPPVSDPTTTQEAALPRFVPNPSATYAPYTVITTTTTPPSVLAVAQRAMAIARKNVLDYHALDARLDRAALAHTDGLTEGDFVTVPPFNFVPNSTPPPSTTPPTFSLGRFIYDSLIHTTPPPTTTMPLDLSSDTPQTTRPVLAGDDRSWLGKQAFTRV
eukprot:gnl/TRDRNA2_/TRDRNA2_178523_c0_seq1.p1 gnl/TRDRNA2_/TRDRNA2_178523_c0~~gnl/TRDRNA2_/TRDRNA2_178523_c0_seq1.p1  ORF type:complete len:314 (+),score=31.07 gnl/TRDRNA2_/TRDRNA2_178523_c0_seq1:67-1008(+)